jgi:hypothetical protein
MGILNLLHANSRPAMALAFAASLVLAGCNINVKKSGDGESKKVDIETPMGGIHVSKDADARDTGLEVYPGARKKADTNDGEEKSANVRISSGLFGVKVVAIEFESDDPPQKLISYYKDQLKKYGNVLECRTERHRAVANADTDDESHSSKQLKCEGDNKGSIVELKTGTEENQHLVSIGPEGKGSSFALVYIQTRGKEKI